MSETKEKIKRDNTKSIRHVGELALRISNFDSYRQFTLYKDVREGLLMDVSGNQKYYLVFKSQNKEIRIPEYDPKGAFEVDKVGGCILFKITKKNAEDILSMKNTDRIFHIIRVFEEQDEYGMTRVTDEVEVYHGRWGDDAEFSSYSTQNKIDLLSSALAAQIAKNASLLKDYNDLLEKYNAEVQKNTDLEKEIILLGSEIEALEIKLSAYVGDTHEGTLLSTDTKYIAFENAMDNISFTEEQLNEAVNKMNESGAEYTNIPDEDVSDNAILNLIVNVGIDNDDLKISTYKNNVLIGSAKYNNDFTGKIYLFDGDEFKFVCEGVLFGTTPGTQIDFTLKPNFEEEGMKNVFVITKEVISPEKSIITAKIDYKSFVENEEYNYDVNFFGEIGTLECIVK